MFDRRLHEIFFKFPSGLNMLNERNKGYRTQDFLECGAVEECGPVSYSYSLRQRVDEPNEAKDRQQK